MIQEEKQLLLKDLCARLPYGVMCDFVYNIGYPQKLLSISLNEKYQIHLDSDEYVFGSGKSYSPSEYKVEDIKPYLRPMSSMTDEERKEYTSYCFEQPFLQKDKTPNLGSVPMCIDWLNKNMFDYRGLIPMDLALEAPEGMYKRN